MRTSFKLFVLLSFVEIASTLGCGFNTHMESHSKSLKAHPNAHQSATLDADCAERHQPDANAATSTSHAKSSRCLECHHKNPG